MFISLKVYLIGPRDSGHTSVYFVQVLLLKLITNVRHRRLDGQALLKDFQL